jgi:HlyD family secretion protein
MTNFKKILIIAVPVILIVISITVLLSKANKPEEVYITGIVEATHVDVSSKVAGRIDSVLVKEGEQVFKGQIVATIISKELDAKLEQTKSIMEAAYQKLQMAVNGARPEEKEMAERLYMQSKHQLELAENTYNRIIKLYRDSLISAQEKDQVEFQYKAANEQMETAKAKYELVLKGARNEEILMADASYRQSENAYREVLAYKEELTIVSPLHGEISKRIVDPGEIVSAGYPVFTVTDLSDEWVILQIREDQMSKIKKDAVMKAKIPALGNGEYEFVVSYISPVGDYATWKPTNQKGEFDLKTFEIRLRAKTEIQNLRPGMTVNVKLN